LVVNFSFKNHFLKFYTISFPKISANWDPPQKNQIFRRIPQLLDNSGKQHHLKKAH
jgi:hypothetical protein